MKSRLIYADSKPATTEEMLQAKVVRMLRMNFPDLLFTSAPHAGLQFKKKHLAQSAKAQGYTRGWPDLFIPYPSGLWHGLALELKSPNARLFTKKGRPATDTIARQVDVLGNFFAMDYAAAMVADFVSAEVLITAYIEKGFRPTLRNAFPFDGFYSHFSDIFYDDDRGAVLSNTH